ncbi:MAG: DUF2493 domain-containing protein [Beijerinckiaceae bacterium]|nr:DUF2493 domain-containing protein [Beijerinckiaceae bacterium]
MTIDHQSIDHQSIDFDHDLDRHHAGDPMQSTSPTAFITDRLELFGYRPTRDEPDPRSAPSDDHLHGAIVEAFEALAATLADTRSEPDLADLLSGIVGTIHRSASKLQRLLDDNEDAQKRSQTIQDGSEIRSVELERLIEAGEILMERRDALELMRDHAAEAYRHHTGSDWRPRSGSNVNHRTLTATMIDSRDFISAKRRSEIEIMMPKGTRIAFTGGMDCNDHMTIWAALDRVKAKHTDMVLLHGGSPKGAELIAAKWAEQRKVPQIVFKPDWTRHAKAAPFKRNDLLLETLPIGLVVFPGSGISDNLADKARQMGIPLMDFRKGG